LLNAIAIIRHAVYANNMGVRTGGQNGHWSPLEIGPKNQNFVENMKSAAQFPVND